ncbi:MAG: hypothetical protein HQL15_00435 [Candidatus Omnitrophica bacterium]|nr:hypothetical protein [Candidatus Omnitrophota bacterium]
MSISFKKNLILLGLGFLLMAPVSQESWGASLKDNLTEDFASTIIQLSDPATGIPPSHFGHPGFKHLTFLYDVSINAMMLKMSGHQGQAERIMDYFAKRLKLPSQQIQAEVDSNNVLGVLKVLSPDGKVVSFVNAFDLNSNQQFGRGQLEFLTTPGPISFMIMAFLQVNQQKYLPEAIHLGNAILSMQRADGGIYDGDRSINKVHTEPHLDGANALYQLYEVTKDSKWRIAADKAIAWFKDNVYMPKSAQIFQGMWDYKPSTIFATDVYSWTMAGMLGDSFSLEELEGLTNTMLRKCLSQVTAEFPGGVKQTMVMADFADSRDPAVIQKRGTFHPMGSPEWSGGVVLALQKNAVRFWNKGQFEKARRYKAIADYLLSEVLKSQYKINKLTMFAYATAQGIEVGHGWKTPYFYVKNPDNPIEGGSLVGGWAIMPMNGFNPFILNDNYFATYQKINASDLNRRAAIQYVAGIVALHQFKEPVVTLFVDKKIQIIEPNNYNASAWNCFNQGKYIKAIFWAKKVMDDPRWVELAQREEKLKTKRIGGIINYPWGVTYKNNENALHLEIWKYPMLNEVATSMWLLASSNYEIGNKKEAKYWIKRLVEELPHHQIAHLVMNPDTGKMDLIDGYWNAIVSWAKYPAKSNRDKGLVNLILEMGLRINSPNSIIMNPIEFPTSPQ